MPKDFDYNNLLEAFNPASQDGKACVRSYIQITQSSEKDGVCRARTPCFSIGFRDVNLYSACSLSQTLLF